MPLLTVLPLLLLHLRLDACLKLFYFLLEGPDAVMFIDFTLRDLVIAAGALALELLAGFQVSL